MTKMKIRQYLHVKYLPDHLVEITWKDGKKEKENKTTVLSFLQLEEIYMLAKSRREEKCR